MISEQRHTAGNPARVWPILGMLLVSIVAALFSDRAAVIAVGSSSLRVSPAETSIASTSPFEISVLQDTPAGSTGAQASVHFDRTKLQVLDVVVGSAYAGSNFFVGIVPQTKVEAIAEANTSTGVLFGVSAYFNPGTTVPSGDQEFLVITMQALPGASGVSTITLTDVEMLDAAGYDITGITTTPAYVGIALPSGDDDGDGIADPADNCPTTQNPAQFNTDGNFIDQTPPSTVDDLTRAWSDTAGDNCDADDDNDGLLDTAEAAGCNGSGPLDPLNGDTDQDAALDGAECAIGVNPASAASKPTATQCATLADTTTSADTDGDKLLDRIEVCGYNTFIFSMDSDFDGVKDGCEAISLNGDSIVNSGDQLLWSAENLRVAAGGTPHLNFDVNKDGSLNAGDQLLMAQFLPPGTCP